MDKWSTSHSFSFPFPLFLPLKIRCKTKKKKKKEKKMDRWSHQLSFCFPFPILVFLTAWNRTSVGALCPCRLDRISFSTKLGLIKCKRWKLRYIFWDFQINAKGKIKQMHFWRVKPINFPAFLDHRVPWRRAHKSRQKFSWLKNHLISRLSQNQGCYDTFSVVVECWGCFWSDFQSGSRVLKGVMIGSQML